MAPKTAGRRKQVRIRGRKGGAKKQPRNMAMVWCLIGALIVGLLLAYSQSGGEPGKKVRRPRPQSVVKKEVKPELPTPQKEAVVAPEPEPQPEPEQDEDSTYQPEPEPVVSPDSQDTPGPTEIPNTPVIPLPDDESEEDEEDEEKSREDRLNATSQNGEYYIDMKTRSLLFTEDSSLNDENLELYLEETYAATESERYDEEAAERPDENKQVK